MTILRIWLELVTNRFEPSPQIPIGLQNCAAFPIPSVAPQKLLPANVLTAAVAMTIWRMLLLLESVTYRLIPSPHSFAGLLNRAAAPIPFTLPALPALPARVETVFVARTNFRI